MKTGNLNRYFNTSFQERISVFTLIGLLFCTTSIYLYIHWNPPIPDFTLEQLKLAEEPLDSISYNTISISLNKEFSHHPFNPNKVTAQELNSLGIPLKTASAWEHYLKKGGKFKQSEEVKKIFGMNEILFNKIAPYMLLESEAKEVNTALVNIKSNIVIDPNTANYEELMQAGFSGKMANTLMHYRGTGKKFTTINDLIKIYGMNDSLLQAISDNIHFTEPIASSSVISPALVNSVAIHSSVDLNKADTILLKSLPGLGHVPAFRIISYREKLGGYFSIDQLKEVYGLPDSTIDKIRPRLTLSVPYRKIKINLDSLTMIYHPYLSKKDAVIIQNYRHQHGQFQTIKDLDDLKAFDPGYWERILPYLDFSVK